MDVFFDTHIHLMTLEEPDFAAFLSPLVTSPVSFFSGGLTKDYIPLAKQRTANDIENTLVTFTQTIVDTMTMMEDDLRGLYRSPSNRASYPDLPYLRDGMIHFRKRTYGTLVLCPLVMDFTHPEDDGRRTYYPLTCRDKLTPYLEKTLDAIASFARLRPASPIRFMPFSGISPHAHSQAFLEDYLSRWLDLTHRPDGSKPFFGVKLYPPLGCDPWPSDQAELKKMRTLYSFCSRHRIPIITHCDDQGFRGIDARLAWKYTDPASWRTVLENYPDLVIDFAHVGRQYGLLNAGGNILDSLAAKLKGQPTDEWFYSLMGLIQDFDNVYSDISFTGAYRDFYVTLGNYMKSLDNGRREKLQDRLMFGSDFSINLLRVESYSAWWRIVETSVLSDDLVHRMVSVNPARFLGLEADALCDDASTPRRRLPAFRRSASGIRSDSSHTSS